MKSTTTKTLIAATMAALAVPSAASATGPGHDGHGDKASGGGAAQQEQRSEDRGERGDPGEERGHRSERWLTKGRRSFVISGVDASGLAVTDGKLSGAITLDPTAANRGARVLLGLTKEELAGEDTVTFGTAGDTAVVKFRGLTATDALQPTDRVQVLGTIRKGVLDVRFVKVTRATTTEQPAPAPAPTTPQG